MKPENQDNRALLNETSPDVGSNRHIFLKTVIAGIIAGIFVFYYQSAIGPRIHKWIFESERALVSGCAPDPHLITSTVKAGSYEIPLHLKLWTQRASLQPAIVNADFEIMRREIIVDDFESVLESLDEQERFSLLANWSGHEEILGNSKTTPLYGVPVGTAFAFAEILSMHTKCHYSLPTYDQWLAAVVVYDDPNPIVRSEIKSGEGPKSRETRPDIVYDLLGNLREWSSQSCNKASFYLLGEDYLTLRDAMTGEPHCTKYPIKTAGFRLVLNREKAP